MDTVTTRKLTVRPLTREDLEAVVAIDVAIEGRPRRAYFERRVAAALREPRMHAQFAAWDDDGIAGFILARVLNGEFGRSEPGLRLEAVGVRTDARGRRIGAHLLDALCDYARRHGIREVRTQAHWTHHAMLGWLDAMGFALAACHVFDCAVGDGSYLAARDDPVAAPDGDATREIDYGRPEANDHDRLARDEADVAVMDWMDLADVVRIDRAITGRDRHDFMKQQLCEAMQESALRVSLTARHGGAVAGFLMARADLGDFGRMEPVAVIDTIGVHPDFAHRGIGHALLSQLFVNLAALRIERVETVLAPRDVGLLGFLYDVGFRPSQRLPFVRPLG
ncbi:MAG: GNAT family N-acetyltransferase [Burkholderiales bacterium]